MDNDEDGFIQDVNLRCTVCGESNFNVLEGFFYCLECGTKQEQVRAIEVDQEEAFNEGALHAVRHKLKKQKSVTAAAELTSWECYNYILRGMVEDLMSLGAKEELKLMTLQIWAAYLRRNEVAFFNKKQADLPKLGVRYFPRDARTLYNHNVQKLKRKRESTHVCKGDEEKKAMREWKRSKRKLDESAYTMKSAADADRSLNASIKANSTAPPIKLNYSMVARKALKKIMPKSHLAKHEQDADGILQCHNMRPKSRSFGLFQQEVTTMNIKQIYAVLAIALNMISDDIQLTDLLRFIAEEHISTRNVLRYLPENIGEHGKELLHEFEFNNFDDKYTDKSMREHIAKLARFIPINEFNQPNMKSLVQRYLTDLDLPSEFGTYVVRLVNLLPPKFNKRALYQYPHYEARAMAYIVFVLKLLFGLDGEKEERISKSASEINEKLQKLKQTTGHQQPLLFVWSEWLEFIEMRKVIVSQFNVNFCKQFKQMQSTDQIIDEQFTKERQQKEQEHNHRELNTAKINQTQTNMQRIFNSFLQMFGDGDEQHGVTIAFQPSLTPSHTYFKRLLMYADSKQHNRLLIPEFMKVDHTLRTMLPFVDATNLTEVFRASELQLKVQKIACTEQRYFVGIYRNPRDEDYNSQTRAYAVDTNITKEEWLTEIGADQEDQKLKLNANLVFKKKLENYGRSYTRKLQRKAEKEKALEEQRAFVSVETNKQKRKEKHNEEDDFLNPATLIGLAKTPNNETQRSPAVKHTENANDDVRLSFNWSETFSEKNSVIDKCQKLVTQILLDASSDDNEDYHPPDVDRSAYAKEEVKNTLTLLQSNFDCWSLIGYTTSLTDEDKKVLYNKFPPSFIWLLETCAQTIGIEWSVLYEQLLIIEMMYTHGITGLDDFNTNGLRYTHLHTVKDINALTNHFRLFW